MNRSGLQLIAQRPMESLSIKRVPSRLRRCRSAPSDFGPSPRLPEAVVRLRPFYRKLSVGGDTRARITANNSSQFGRTALQLDFVFSGSRSQKR
jgi:hypothetical protein